MAVSISVKAISLEVQRRLAHTSAALSTSWERLASGQRINRASDDPAGLALSSALQSDSRIQRQAIRNINDGISALNIAEGALEALSSISARQLELATQAANGAYTLEQRRALDAEANALVDEFNRVVTATSFNGRQLVDASAGEGTFSIQAGKGSGNALLVNLGEELARSTGSGSFQATLSYASADKWSYDVGLIDLNNDAHLDLVTADYPGGRIGVRLGNGNGSFQARASYRAEPYLSQKIWAGDINGDNKADVISVGYDGFDGTATVLLGNGNGTLKAPTSFFVQGVKTYDVELVDLNADGKLDLVTCGADKAAVGYGGYLSVAFGNSNGTFAGRTSFKTEDRYSHGFILGDVNGDGRLDAVTVGIDAGTNSYMTVLIGNGDGTFSRKA